MDGGGSCRPGACGIFLAPAPWRRPVTNAQFRSQQLPTEAEWPWGKEDPTWRRASQRRGTTPVGSFLEGASPYGALDMAGNVWEWCDDTDDPAFHEDGRAL